jgi:hypothetical protein
MKKITLLLTLLVSSLFSFSQDSVKVFHNSVKTYELIIQPTVIRDTVKIIVHDTLVVYKCDTIKPVIDTLYRGLYVGSFDTKLGTTAATDLLNYCKQLKFNGLSFYGLGNILGNSTKESQLASFNKSARAQGIKTIEAVRGTGSSFSGSTATYNRSRTDTNERFTSFNLEYEFWNQSNISSAWVTDSGYVVTMKSTAQQLGLKSYTQYVGWFPSPVEQRSPKFLSTSTTHLLVHYYRTTPDAAYGKYRLDSLNAIAKRGNYKVLVRPIFSAEPAFMQNWFKTATPDSAFKSWYSQFKTYNYSNLVSDGYQIFTDDFLRVSIPLKSTSFMNMKLSSPSDGTVEENKMEIIPNSPNFKNKTTKSHLKTSEEK